MQYSAHGVATRTESATRSGSLLRRQISTIAALFPYSDTCHVKYSAHELSVPIFPALVATSIVAVPIYSGLKGCIYKPCQYLYLATQTTKRMVKITMALLQCTHDSL